MTSKSHPGTLPVTTPAAVDRSLARPDCPGARILTLGLFDKRIEGDDCLMELVRLRFGEAGMGAEVHPITPDHLEWLLQFLPAEDLPVIVHLARNFDLAENLSRERIMEFASRFAGRVHGYVIHDHPAMAADARRYVEAAWEIENRLGKVAGGPLLFVEYAAGLAPDDFVRFFAAIQDLDRVSACVDIGHIGIRQAQVSFAQRHPGEDICSLKSNAIRAAQVMEDLEAAVRAGAAAALDLIERIGVFKKPVHLHLHDAHPLSTSSPYGVSDHLSFFAEVPLAFEYRDRRLTSPMFGPGGLSEAVQKARQVGGRRGLSFTLEIHPGPGQLPLGNAEALFGHWTDKSNAERMNRWLSELARNHVLLRQAIQSAGPPVNGLTTAEQLPGAPSVGLGNSPQTTIANPQSV